MPRQSSQSRKTAETDITLSLDLDGSGNSTIDTGIGFFDHMLTLFSRHSLIDLQLKAIGDLHIDGHHTVEDTAIVLGTALREALGDKSGITRYGHAYLPMDETLARVVIDLSNRPFLEFHTPPGTASAPNFPLTLTEEFCRALAANLRANIHVEVLYGRDGHHVAEAIFKGMARALRTAVTVDPRVVGVPSTKESL
jgi:imidazoleglycerol-phosphate dehydratase